MVTAIPAAALGLGDEVGTLRPGRLADLLVVQGDPLQSMRALLDVVAVYQGGRPGAGPHPRPAGRGRQPVPRRRRRPRRPVTTSPGR